MPIAAGTTYVASYYAPAGGTRSTKLLRHRLDHEARSPPRPGTDGANGVYQYGASGFPNNSYQATNYWVDVVSSG